jgi:large subunit ribosomal protein L1
MAKEKNVGEVAAEKTEKKAGGKKKPIGLRRHGKKYLEAMAKFELQKRYLVQDAFELLPTVTFAKFDETVDVAFKLGVDPKHADQMVRGALVLPNGTGKTARVAVLAKGDKAREAEAAGADIVGAEDLIEKISGGWLEFDKMIATPDMMVAVSKVGKILGPRGLMPNPKLGTVTFDVTKAIKEQKLGKVEYRTEKTGIIHVPIGKKSFGPQKLRENFLAVANAVIKAKPPTAKGVYLQGVTISATMSPGISVDTLDTISQSAGA